MNDLLRAAADAGVPASPVTEVQFRNFDSVASKVFTSFTLKIPPIPGKSAALANLQQMKAQFQSAARNFAAIQAAAKQTATQPVAVQNPGLPKVSAI